MINLFTASPSRMAQKGLLLVSIPLVFELLVFGVLLFLMTQVELERDREARAKTVIVEATALGTLLYQFGMSLSTSTSGVNLLQQRLPQDYARIHPHLTSLNNLRSTSVNAHERECIRRISLLFEELISIVNEIRSAGGQQERSRLLEEGLAIAPLLNSQLQDLAAFEANIETTSSQAAQTCRDSIVVALVIAVLLSIAIAIFLASYFGRQITERIAVIVENSRMLAAGRPLIAIQQGENDEIFEMDKAFHDMANQLDETERKRKELELLKRDFLAMVSHDLRSPMMSVNAVLSLLSCGAFGALNERGEDAVVRALRSTDRLVLLVNELLDIEKLEAGELELNRSSWGLDEILESAAEAVDALAEQQAVSIDVVASGLQVCVDKQRLTQVIVNLLSNAVKFSPTGGTVLLESKYTDDTHSHFEVRVIDQGPGVPLDEQAQIFSRFKQTKSESKTARGTGLGLAIAKALVEQHGGEIAMESTPGKGSIFSFRISCESPTQNGSETREVPEAPAMMAEKQG